MSPNTINQWVNSKNNLLAHPKYKEEEVIRFINLRRKLIKECAVNGVDLLLGSDAPQVFDVPGFAVHHELRYLVESGLSPYQALQTGTVNVGRFLNRNQGVVRVGALADLVLLSGNPLSDIRNTSRIEGVMIGGQWLSKDWIEKTLKDAEK